MVGSFTRIRRYRYRGTNPSVTIDRGTRIGIVQFAAKIGVP
jgi:hypothetical protein